MTSDEFRAEYRVGQRLTSVGIRTTLAQESRKGRIVLVHELAHASEPEQRRARILLRELGPNEASQVIGTFDVDGETVVVTKFLLGFTSLLGWLEAAVAESSTTVIVTSDNPSTMDMAIHNPDYRRPLTDLPLAPALEDTSTKPVLASPVDRTPTPPPVQSSPTSSVTTPEDEPTSSFTKLFGESESSPAPLAPSDAGPPNRSGDGPGEFTLNFGAPAVDATAASQDPGIDVSRGFRAPEAMSLPPVLDPAPAGAAAQTEPTPDESTTADEPGTGDFTRLFGNEPNVPPPGPATPKPPPAVHAIPSERPKTSPPPAPFVRQPSANVFAVDETGPSPIAPIADTSLPPPPRVRLEALEGVPVRTDSGMRGEYDSGPRAPASVPPAPFSAPPLVPVQAGRTQTPAPQSNRPAAPSPLGNPATLAQGGYTEVLTPARPPLSAAPPRNPTPTVAPAAPPARTSYIPLIVGLIVFAVLMAALVAYFVMSSS